MSSGFETIADSSERRGFLGGSDARIIMGSDEANLIRLWREKRSEIEPEDLSENLIVQQSALVRAQHRALHQRRPKASTSPRPQVDGRNTRRDG
jgi:hypothetical protein